MRLPGEDGSEAQNAVAKPKHGAKHAFILEQPLTMSGPEVVARGAAKGLRFNAAYVAMVRMRARKAASRPPRRRGRPPKNAAAIENAAAALRTRSTNGSSAEERLRVLALQIGLVRAERLIVRIRRIVAEMRW